MNKVRRFLSFPIADQQHIKRQMLSWGNSRFNICCLLDNHHYNFTHHSVECVLAAGAIRKFHTLSDLSAGLPVHDWLFGHFSYDLKNAIEPLHSDNKDGIGFPDLFFYVPEVVILLKDESLQIGVRDDSHSEIFNQIINTILTEPPKQRITVKQAFSRKEYIKTVEKLKSHILRGDCYEVNLCQEFFAENIDVDPLALHEQLSQTSPNPFAAYYRVNDKYISCMSPERYLHKQGNTIMSQPIKGTAARKANQQEDALAIEQLKGSEKERAENIMIVDLVRNDLSKISKEGTVKVDELCEIYSFPQVHQMISTVSGELRDDITLREIISATFPMGSMTGAPKRRVMQLIEQYERSKRGLFSGSIGYINPANDFDFNVVIRSVLYNSTQRYLSFHTGSAITFSSDPEQEYEECLLKASAIKKVLA